MTTRRQASLFLSDVPDIESIRQRYNPAQAKLIPAHVTLCREDEIADWDQFQQHLQSLCSWGLTLEFGTPIRDGDFVYLPVLKGLEDFHQLRRKLLGHQARCHNPHLTLIHPRNGVCTDNIFSDIQRQVPPFQYHFQDVRLIEQRDGGAWHSFADGR